MRIPRLVKDVLKYLPVLAVMAATVIGLLIGKSIHPALLDSQPVGRLWFEDSQVLLIPGSLCSSNIYTSLPPKCRTADGEFVPLPGSATLMLIPEGK